MAIPTTLICKLLTGSRPFDGITGSEHPFLTASANASGDISNIVSTRNDPSPATDGTQTSSNEALEDFISTPPMSSGAAQWAANKEHNWVYVKNSMSITARILSELSARLGAIQQLMDSSAKKTKQRQEQKNKENDKDPPASPVDDGEPIFEITSYVDKALPMIQIFGGLIGCFGQFSSLFSALPLSDPSYGYNGLNINKIGDQKRNQWTEHAKLVRYLYLPSLSTF